MEKSEKRTMLWEYCPAIVSGLLTVTTIILYSTIIEHRFWSVYVAMAIMACVPFLIVFLNRKFHLGLPQYLIILLCSHAVFSTDMGTALGFYGKWPWWDTAVHTYFGFLAGAVLFYLYRQFKGEPKIIDFVVIVLLVISFAAIWEVYEYVAGAILDSDMQDVERLMAEGKNPISDTMLDIVVAAAGAAVFFIGYIVVKYIFRPKNRSEKSE